MAPPTGEATRRLWSALVDVYQPVLRDVVVALEQDAGIDSGVYSALAYLDRAGGRMRIGELHDHMRVRYSQPGLSRLVQRMEADQLIRRDRDSQDRRATVVVLTRTGRARFRRAHDAYDAALDRHLGPAVDPEDAIAITAALERLAAGVTARRVSRDSRRPSSGSRRS